MADIHHGSCVIRWKSLALSLLLAVAGHSLLQAEPTSAKAARSPAAGSRGPAEYLAPHFKLHSDLSPKEAEELLRRLETMFGLISKYWGRPPAGVIEMFVVKDLSKWPPDAFHPRGRAKIEEGAGVTITQSLTLGGQKVAAAAVVYAVADHGTPQHEAVHAYCGQTFGTTGPLWYSEGMAEMGQYWKQGDSSVNCDPVIVKYIRSSEPKSLNEIVNPKEEVTGDSWQNYAWRWALCHMLANNVNYRDRFRPLGLGFLTEQPVSFEQTYGSMADEISFEYRFFLEHLGLGYRVDLCSWEWKKKFKPLAGGTPAVARIAAARGWQASGVTVTEGQAYDYSTTGVVQLEKAGGELSADGDKRGNGKLVGVIFKDFKLSEEFPLGTYGSFTALGEGKLFLRCNDAWNQIPDNKGSFTVKLKLAGKGDPLPKPKPEALKEADPKSKPDETQNASAKPAVPTKSAKPRKPMPSD